VSIALFLSLLAKPRKISEEHRSDFSRLTQTDFAEHLTAAALSTTIPDITSIITIVTITAVVLSPATAVPLA